MKITNKMIADQILKTTEKSYDPGYISSVRTGSRKSPELLGIIMRAVSQLSRAARKVSR